MTKDEIYKIIEDAAAKDKTTKAQAVQEFIQAEGNAMAITNVFGRDLKGFYKECATRWPTDAAAFKKAANDWFVGKFFVNDAGLFLDDIQKTDDETAYYHCKVFQQLDKNTKKVKPVKFPNGSLSYIGARTGRGKTTAMISMAVDAVTQDKTTYFFTNEEGTKQIIMRLVKAFLYLDFATGAWPASFDYNDKKCNYDFEPTAMQDLDIERDYTQFIRDTLKHPEMEAKGHELQRHVWASFKKVANLLASRQITIIDGLAQKTFDDLEMTLENIKAGAVVFLDYIQHARKPEASTAQLQLQKLSQTIADAAALKGFVVVSGAQLGRGSMEGVGKNDADKLGEQYFRESGDLEQDAHIIIQIGMQKLPDGTTDDFGCNVSRFYEILKHRDHEQDTSQYRIMDNAGFSLYGCTFDGTLEYFTPMDVPGDKKKKEPSSNGKATKEHKKFDTIPASLRDVIGGPEPY